MSCFELSLDSGAVCLDPLMCVIWRACRVDLHEPAGIMVGYERCGYCINQELIPQWHIEIHEVEGIQIIPTTDSTMHWSDRGRGKGMSSSSTLVLDGCIEFTCMIFVAWEINFADD